MKGQCNCGAVKFEIDNFVPKFFEYHCSLGLEQEVSASITATIIGYEKLHWLTGLEKISTWENNIGILTDFCSVCGSLVPKSLKDPSYYWVPAGSFKNVKVEICAHVYIDSKGEWDNITSEKVIYNKEPDITELVCLLSGEEFAYS